MSSYTTGELAKQCGVSVRTVQFYDGRGLLHPSALSEGGRQHGGAGSGACSSSACSSPWGCPWTASGAFWKAPGPSRSSCSCWRSNPPGWTGRSGKAAGDRRRPGRAGEHPRRAHRFGGIHSGRRDHDATNPISAPHPRHFAGGRHRHGRVGTRPAAALDPPGAVAALCGGNAPGAPVRLAALPVLPAADGLRLPVLRETFSLSSRELFFSRHAPDGNSAAPAAARPTGAARRPPPIRPRRSPRSEGASRRTPGSSLRRLPRQRLAADVPAPPRAEGAAGLPGSLRSSEQFKRPPHGEIHAGVILLIYRGGLRRREGFSCAGTPSCRPAAPASPAGRPDRAPPADPGPAPAAARSPADPAE